MFIVPAISEDGVIVGIAREVETDGALRETSSEPGMGSTRILISPELTSYNSGDPSGPLPYTLSRSNAAVRKFVVLLGVARF